jgi:beta-lactamase regulating signal transducer with metallopeptidase domain
LAASLAVRVVVRGPAARVSLVWWTWLGIAAIAVLTALPAWPRIAIDRFAALPAQLAQGGRESMAAAVHHDGLSHSPLAPDPFDSVLAFDPHDQVTYTESVVPVTASLPPIAAPVPVPTFSGTTVVPAVWSVSVAAGLVWILLGHWRTRRLLTTARAAPAWVLGELETLIHATKRKAKQRAHSTSPGLWSSDRVNSAVALGAAQPQIVLPTASVVETNRPAVRAALAHEWAHIRHGDLWLLALERSLLPLLAVHPLFWWLRRSVRLDQELLADAAAAGPAPVEYAEALLAWAKTAQASGKQPARQGLAAIGMWENSNSLSRRVAMILDPKRPLARRLGRGWTALLAGSLAALVLGLSLITLRPLPAQEDAIPPALPDTIIEVAPPANVHADHAPSRHTTPVTQIHMNLLILSVDRPKLEAADTSLEDEIAAATESRCRKEAGLIVSDIHAEEVVALIDALKKYEAMTVESRPQIVTLDGREANVHIGGEAPLLRVHETINRKHEERIEYQEFGTLLMVRPKLAGEKQDLVTLEIVAEQSNLVLTGEKATDGIAARDLPGLVSNKFKLTSDVKLGGSLLVAQSPTGKKGRIDVKKQFLLIITPQRAVREAAAVYASPTEGEKGEAARAATEAAIEAATAA